MPLQSSKINIFVNNIPMLAESLSISQESPKNPATTIGNSQIFDYVPRGLGNKISLSYLLECSGEPNLSLISDYKNNTTGNLSATLKIGNITIPSFLNNFGFSLLPNQSVLAQASYDCFKPITGELINQPSSTDSNLYNAKSASGIAHYWGAQIFARQSSGVPNPTGILSVVSGLGTSNYSNFDEFSIQSTGYHVGRLYGYLNTKDGIAYSTGYIQSSQLGASGTPIGAYYKLTWSWPSTPGLDGYVLNPSGKVIQGDSPNTFNFNTYLKKYITGLSYVDSGTEAAIISSTDYVSFKPLTPNTVYTTEYLSGANILQLDYSFSSDINPIYSLGSEYPIQVSNFGGNETINFISETQNLLTFSGQHPDTRVELINKIRLNPISHLWSSAGQNIDIQMDEMKVSSSRMETKPGELVVFSHNFSKNF